MIHFLDETLRELFISQIKDEITDSSQVSFELPDDEFCSHVKTLGRSVLNVSLVDMRENRSTAVGNLKSSQTGSALRRVDCHYLISAWSPAVKSAEPVLDEHALLYKALVALMEAEPMVPRAIFGFKPLPRDFPEPLRDTVFPTVVLPVERFPKTAEFWAAAKGVHWKPTIHLVVTLPIVPASLTSAASEL